jgi:Fe-S cluster assembly protein SufD
VGDGASSYHYGLCFGKAHDRFAMNYWSEHVAQATTGHILVHGALFGQSYADFKGNIKIAQTGHKTVASLTEHVLLLGDRARSDAIPQLEINTNDVQAAHSAAATKIDAEQLFYLASRGIPTADGQQLIVRGFLEDIIAHLPDGGLQDEVRKQIDHHLLYVAE